MVQPAPYDMQHASAPEPETDAPGPWHRVATPLGPVTLRVAYHAGSTEAIYELVANHVATVPFLQGTGVLIEGIHARAETEYGAITLQIYLDNQQHLRYTYDLTSQDRGLLRCLGGTLSTLSST